MRNPFSAIGRAFSKAGQAVGNAIGKAIGGTGKALSKAGGALTKTGEKLSTSKAPEKKAPPAESKAPEKKAPPAESKTPAPLPEGKRPPKLPPTDFGPGSNSGGSSGGSISRGISRDEKILGVDSDEKRSLEEAVKDFEAEHRIDLLGKQARDFIDHPSFSATFDKYSTGSGWTADQWFKGMSNVRDVRLQTIKGQLVVTFEADFDIDDYSLGGRTVTATF